MIALAVVAMLGVPSPQGRTHYSIEARVAPDLSTISGRVEIDVINDSGSRADDLTLWLYGQAFADAIPGISTWTEPSYEPWGEATGHMSVQAVQIGGTPAHPVPFDLPDVPPGAALRLPLSRGLEPGEHVLVSMGFSLAVPTRLGPLSLAHGVLTALGGFHPYVTVLDPRSSDQRRRLPTPSNFDLRLSVPRGFIALAGGRKVGAEGAVQLEDRAYLDLFVRPASIEPLRARGGSVFPLHPPPRGGPDEGGLPDPVGPTSAWNGDELQALLGSVARWADARFPPQDAPIDIVVVPMRSELALFTDGAVAVSDRAYGLPPWPTARRAQDLTVARAWLARRLLPLVRRAERPADVRTVADALGAFFAARFLDERGGADVHSFFNALDVIPGLNWLHSPKNAFPQVYLQPVAEPITARDEPWTFAVVAPRGKLLLEKLRDWLGEPGLSRAVDLYLTAAAGAAPCSLEFAVESVAGRDMATFFEAWTTRIPSEDLRVALSDVTPFGDGYQNRILVWRVGATPPEVIEVSARDTSGRYHLLVWRAEAGASRQLLVVRTAAPIDHLRVDPRGRVAQSPQEPGQSPALGDFVPRELQLLITYGSISYRTGERAVAASAGFLLHYRDELSRRLVFDASFDVAHVGVTADIVHGFGGLVDASHQFSRASVGLGASYLRPGFEGAGSGFAAGPHARYAYDSRVPVPEPRTGTAVLLGLGMQVASEGNSSGAFPALDAAVIRLFPVGSQTSLAARLKLAAVGNAAPAQLLIPLGGTDRGLRGFSLDEVLSEREAVLSVEWRHPLLRDVDVDLGLVWLRSLRGALFADAALAAGVLQQGPVGSSRDGQIHPFADVGYGLDLVYDLFQVRPLVLGLDVGIPFGRLEEDQGNFPVTITLRASQAFSGL